MSASLGEEPQPELLWPLLDRFPGLRRIPRLSLRRTPTPVESLQPIAPDLWIKRDDLAALPMGGNKVRSLEFLLGGLHPGDRVTTIGSRGSTHALATAIYARSAGAHASVGVWPQEMNEVATCVSEALDRVAPSKRQFVSPALAIAWLWWRSARGDRAIPAGGTSPLGILGHVNAALELAEQVKRGLLPEPRRIVVPLGSGGTAAGLALGVRIAGLRTVIVAARVVPKVVGRRGRVLRLATATRSFIERHADARIPHVERDSVQVIDDVYGGAYGRVLDRALESSTSLRRAIGISLDATYAAKAFAAAIETHDGTPTLFWLTFDARWIRETDAGF